jgi:hypothetical protein
MMNKRVMRRYVPYPGGGEKWGGNGVGDDLYSFGFDGAFLWAGGRRTPVNKTHAAEPYITKGTIRRMLTQLHILSRTCPLTYCHQHAH